MGLLHQKLTGKIINAYYNVYNGLGGYGFLEKVYEKAMMVELKEMGLYAIPQQPIRVFYKKNNVGEYFTDILVENQVIIELKATKKIRKQHKAQLLNYLKATNIEVGLLMNFGMKPKFERMVFENVNK